MNTDHLISALAQSRVFNASLSEFVSKNFAALAALRQQGLSLDAITQQINVADPDEVQAKVNGEPMTFSKKPIRKGSLRRTYNRHAKKINSDDASVDNVLRFLWGLKEGNFRVVYDGTDRNNDLDNVLAYANLHISPEKLGRWLDASEVSSSDRVDQAKHEQSTH